MKRENKHLVNGYILAGGKSSRMGTDKGLLLLNGRPVIQHIIEKVRPAVSRVIIVANNAAYKQFGTEVITDQIKEAGPVGGIYTALYHSDKRFAFIVSCDMPYINTEAIEFMIQHISHTQIILPVWKNKMEPLFGIYSKECLPLWKQLMEKGILRLHEAVSHFHLQKLTLDGKHFFTEKMFMNINTRKDYENLVKQC